MAQININVDQMVENVKQKATAHATATQASIERIKASAVPGSPAAVRGIPKGYLRLATLDALVSACNMYQASSEPQGLIDFLNCVEKCVCRQDDFAAVISEVLASEPFSPVASLQIGGRNGVWLDCRAESADDAYRTRALEIARGIDAFPWSVSVSPVFDELTVNRSDDDGNTIIAIVDKESGDRYVYGVGEYFIALADVIPA